MPSAPAIMEIRESEASPDIAALYADIRQATALPQVNLIFRHLATRPEVLRWVWETLRPLYLSQELADATSALSRSVPDAGAPSPIPDTLPDDARRACHRVLETYNAGNAQNLIALTTFVALLDGAAADQAGSLAPRAREGSTEPTDRQIIAFPPIPKRNELPSDIQAQLDSLAARHRSAPGVIPSLYVHLSLWPELLPTVDAFLAPRLTTPGWRGQISDLIETAARTARHLAPRLTHSPAPAIAERDRRDMAETIRTFVNATIPEMVIVGRWLTWDETPI